MCVKVKFTELNSGFTGCNKVSRFSEKNRSKMIIAGILVAVFVFVYILSSVGIIPFDALSARLTSFVSQDGENFPLRVSSDSTINTQIIGESIIILTTENFTVYSHSGKQRYSQPHNYSSPAVSVNGDRAVVFDRGKNSYMLVNEKKVLHTGDAPGDIICAEYGAGGNYAFGVRGDNSTSTLVVYSATNKVVFQWNCAYEYISSIALSENCKFAGVAALGAKDGEVFTDVNYFGFDYQEPINTQTLSATTALDIEFTTVNTLTVFSDTGVYSINKKAEEPITVCEYYSSEFNSFDYSQNGKYIVALARYGSANNFLITVYSPKGKEKSVIETDCQLKSVTMSDKYIFALAENSIMVYNLNGMKITQIDVKGDAKSLIPTDKYLFINSLDKISRCYSFGNSTLELGI